MKLFLLALLSMGTFAFASGEEEENTKPKAEATVEIQK